MEAATLEGQVHGYRAALTDEGLVVFDVPIFAACAFDAGKEVVNFDASWVKRAYTKALYKQRVENYKPPMHIRHHEPETAINDSVRKAGYFKVRRTGLILLDGQHRPGIFADLVFTDPSAQWEVRTNQLNYRSVEIFDYTADPIINGLALLDHEAPHLELPMLQIQGPVEDLRTPDGVANANFQAPTSPEARGRMVCFRRAGTSAFVTFKDSTMNKTAEQLADAAEAAEAARIANLGGREVGDHVANLSDDSDNDEANMSDDSDNEADLEADEGGESGIDWKAVAKCLKSGEVMQKDLDLVMEALAGSASLAEPEEEESAAMTDIEIEEKPVQQAAFKKKASAELVAMAKMQGKLDALEAKDRARDAREARVADVAKALSRLKGLPLGADLQGKLVSFHKKHGGAAFGDYVESLAQNTAIEPGEREDQTTAAFKSLGGKVPAVAMKYQNQGVEAVEQASQFAREFQALRDHGAGLRVDEETYVKRNMERIASAS